MRLSYRPGPVYFRGEMIGTIRRPVRGGALYFAADFERPDGSRLTDMAEMTAEEYRVLVCFQGEQPD